VTDEIRKVPRSDFGKSIFPTFDVNVPMPSGTAAPAQSGAGQSSSGDVPSRVEIRSAGITG
jgi:hypothetical protein